MIAAEPYMLVFRVLHIVGGVLWVGSTFLFSAFIGRAAAAIGPAAGPMLHQLVVEERVTKAITGISVVTVAAGGFVYWHDLQIAGSLGDFLDTDFGLALTIGPVLGIIAMFWGYFQVGAKVEQMVAFAGTALTAEGPTASGWRSWTAAAPSCGGTASSTCCCSWEPSSRCRRLATGRDNGAQPSRRAASP